MTNEIIKRPITPIEEFEIALNKAELSDKDYELVDLSLIHISEPTRPY